MTTVASSSWHACGTTPLVSIWPGVDLKQADHREGTGGSSLNISSHSSRHSLQIRGSPDSLPLTPGSQTPAAAAMAATWWRRFPQKLHCSAPPSSLTWWIVAMGVLTAWPDSAITTCVPLIHRSQMYTPGPTINFLTCFWLLPQNEHDSRSPESGTRPPYLGSSTGSRMSSTATSDLACSEIRRVRELVPPEDRPDPLDANYRQRGQ